MPLSTYLWSFVGNGDDTLSREPKPNHNSTKLIPLPICSWISSVQLSVWSNISGPSVQKTWIGVEEPSDELQMTVARHTLAGDISPPDKLRVDTSLQVFSKLDAVVVSCVFGAQHRGGTSKHSLSLIMNAQHLTRFTALQVIFVDRLEFLVHQLRALLDCVPPSRAHAAFGGRLEQLVLQLERLAVPPLKYPSPRDTFVAPEHALELDFVARVVTSMLQTHGCVVVAGSGDAERVNTLIRSLLLFVAPQDLHRCALARPASAFAADVSSLDEAAEQAPASACCQYVPNLLIQGIVDVDASVSAKRASNEGLRGAPDAGLQDHAVIESLLPTTLVLLDSNTVRRTPCLPEYSLLRGQHREFVLHDCASAPDATHAAPWATRDGLFATVKEASPLVERMLEQAFALPSYLCAAYIKNSMRLLMRKAVTLIKFVEANMLVDGEVLPGTVNKLRDDLGLGSTADFTVLLGVAERLRAGTFGDPALVEDRLMELFESF